MDPPASATQSSYHPRLEMLEDRLALAGAALDFSTFLGGQQQDFIRDVTTDSQGNIYITGGTASPDFTTTPGAYDRTFASGGRAAAARQVRWTCLSPSCRPPVSSSGPRCWVAPTTIAPTPLNWMPRATFT